MQNQCTYNLMSASAVEQNVFELLRQTVTHKASVLHAVYTLYTWKPQTYDTFGQKLCQLHVVCIPKKLLLYPVNLRTGLISSESVCQCCNRINLLLQGIFLDFVCDF